MVEEQHLVVREGGKKLGTDKHLWKTDVDGINRCHFLMFINLPNICKFYYRHTPFAKNKTALGNHLEKSYASF
jgi:hypothetical protein